MTVFTDFGGNTSVIDGYDPAIGAVVSGSSVGTAGAWISHRGMYRSHVWVNVAVNLRSRGVAKTPLKTYRDNPDTDKRERVRGRGRDAHPLARLIEKPWEGGNRFALLNKITLEYLIDPRAEALVWMDRPSITEPPTRLIPMRGDQLVRQLKADGTVGFYEWRETPAGTPHRLLPEYVARFGFEDGVSPLTALANELRIDSAAQRTTASFYENGAKVGGVLTTEQKLPPETVEQIAAELRGEHRGPDNAFRTLVLANMPGSQWHTPTVSSTDAQTIEHRKGARDATLAGYHVPQPMGGVLDRATFSNIETQTRMWVVDSLGEDFAMLEGAFNSQIVATVAEWEDGGYFVEFDTGEILRGAPLQRAEAYGKWLNAGVRTPNELRQLENLPRIEDDWADCIYIPVNLTPSGLPGGASATPPANGRVRHVQPPAPAVPDTSGAETS